MVTVIEGTTYKADRDAVQHMTKLHDVPYLLVFGSGWLAVKRHDPKSDARRVQDGLLIVCLYMIHGDCCPAASKVVLTSSRHLIVILLLTGS